MMSDVRRLRRVGVCGGLLALVAYLDACSGAGEQSDRSAAADTAAADSAAQAGDVAAGGTGRSNTAGVAVAGRTGRNFDGEPCNYGDGVNAGMNGRPETDAARTLAYVRTLCFANDTVGDDPPAKKGGHPQLLGNLLLMPESQMHASPVDTLQRGRGLVAALLHNFGPGDLKGPPLGPQQPSKWRGPLRPRQEALIWYGRDSVTDSLYSVLFRIVGSEAGGRRIVVIDTGGVRLNPDTARSTPKALWDTPHPHLGHPGSGWISCLSGCCTASRIFSKT